MAGSRREMLQQFLEQNPNDAFARYGLAMEEVREGHAEAALAQFEQVMTEHPDYCAAYQQAGQLLLSLERREQARQVLERGIATAARQGNAHARGEMQALLEETGG